jgi:ATP phosphoribosyltransferase
MPRKIIAGLYDAGILGRDIAEEWRLAGYPLECYGLLGYGKVRIVAASDKPLEYVISKGELYCETEYPYITREWLGRMTGKRPAIQSKFGTVPGDNGCLIVESSGATEASIYQGADLIVDTVQTGSTLKENGLKELDELLQSEAGLYARPGFSSIELAALAEKLQKAT